MDEIKKIVFVGMENAGKTSIINHFTQHILDSSPIKPTNKVERIPLAFLGKEIIIWDFGGQEKYREKYLESPTKFFDAISFLFFVVDVQDSENLDLSIAYFDKIYEQLERYSPEAKISILFHKNDPEAQKVIAKSAIETQFLETITPAFKASAAEINTRGNLNSGKYYRTSTHNPMSIIHAISETLLGRLTINQTISDILKVFIDTNQLRFGMMITQNNFEIGHAIAADFSGEERDHVLEYFFKNILLNPNLRIELGFKTDIPLKLFMYSFDVSHKTAVIPLFLIVIYECTQDFPNKEAILNTFVENFGRLVGSMNLLDVLHEN